MANGGVSGGERRVMNACFNNAVWHSISIRSSGSQPRGRKSERELVLTGRNGQRVFRTEEQSCMTRAGNSRRKAHVSALTSVCSSDSCCKHELTTLTKHHMIHGVFVILHTCAYTHTHTPHTVQQPHIEGFTQERPPMSWPLNPNKAPPSPSTMHPQTHLLLPQAGESPQRDQPGRVWCHGPSPPESSDPAPARSARSLQTPQLGASDRVGAKKLCTLQAMSTWALATPTKN